MTDNSSVRTAPKRRGLSRIAGNLALAAVALLVTLLLCELLLRLLGVGFPVYVWTDPVRGVAHIPGAKSPRQYQGQSWVAINSDGWRGPEVALKAPAGTFRIALLGDSYIEAFEVPFDETVGELLESRLATRWGTPVEVLNFGHGGYGTAQELLTLQHEVWKYSPDLVLLAVTTGNDISDNYRSLKRSDYVPYYVFRGDSLVLDSSFVQSSGFRSRARWTRRLLVVVQHSRLAQLINRSRRLNRKEERQQRNMAAGPGEEVGMRDEVHLPPTDPDWQEAWRVTEGIIRMMHEECRRHDTPFAMVTLTRGIQVTPDREQKEKFLRRLGVEDLYYPERRLADLGEREGIPVLNLAPAMAKQAEERQVYFHAYRDSLGIGHWSPEGHMAAAELIAPWLADRFSPDSTTSPTPHVIAR